jgi:metallophosphoesterase (TIGR00282 family)
MRLLFLGDVVGRPGRRAVTQVVPRLIAREGIDFVVANCENASGGKGINPDSADELIDCGVDVLTSGNHVWQNSGIVPYIQESDRLLRPENFPPGVPGRGWTVRESARAKCRVGVLNLIGRVFMGPADCPFHAATRALEALRKETPVILVDMHGEATSEKVGMGRFLDGKVSAVLGSHTHVQTADEAVLPGGTASLTDAGMCGPIDSILGVRSDQVLRRFLTQMPVRFEVASGPVVVQGALVDVDQRTGRATAIRRLREQIDA